MWAASTLNFPRLSFEEDFLTGIAIVNPTDQEAVVTFTAYDQSGQLLTGTGITNPAAPETIPGNQQLAKLTSDLFGEGLDPATVAWFQATSPADDLTGFFLFLSIPLPATNFDGADLPPADSTIVFTQLSLASGDSTELNIINPSSATADLQLELVRTDTIPVTKSLSIPAMGAARLDAATFFGISEAGPDSYITVTSNVDIAGFELIRFLQGDMIGSNARSGAEQLTHLYFPQMVVLGVAETTLGVVNQGTQAVILTITAFQPNGSIYGTEDLQSNPVTRALNPGESLVEDVETMFGFSGQEILDGWLQVESTSEAVTGFVSYGTPITGAKATVAPASTGRTRAIFSHIVTIEEFFTRVAVLNAGQLATNVRILAITTSGTTLGSFSTVLQPGQRISELITTLIPEAANQGGGLIWVKSDLPVHFTSLFGSTQVLANIPPQTAPASYNPDSGLPTFEVSPTLAIVQTSQFKGFQVEGGSGGEIWRVNGLEGGEAATGTITSEGLYAAPSQAPTPRVLTISAEGTSQTAGASVDVLDKSALFTSEQIVQSVAFLNSLQRIYTAELAILSTAQQFSSPQFAAPQQEAIDSEVFEVPAPGIPKISLASFPNETISKMISFVASTTGTVIRLNPTTSESVVVASSLNAPSSLVVDPTSGDLLVAEKDRVTTVPKDQLESGLVALARTGGADLQPQSATLFSTDRADGIAVDRCTGDVFTSDTPLGVIRQLVAATGEIKVAASGLPQPGQLLSLYRDGVSCPDSFQLLVAEAGSDFLRLIVPSQGLVVPWIEAFGSTDLSLCSGGNSVYS